MKKFRLAIILVLVLSMVMGTTAFAASSGKSRNGITAYEEYSSVDIFGNMFLIVMVRNDNSVNCAVSMNASSTTSDGKKIETVSSETVYLEPGAEYALVAPFTTAASAAAPNYDYDLVVDSNLSSFDAIPCTDFIDGKFSDDGKGSVKVYATNTSPYTVQAQAIVVFYKNDKIVDFQEMYLSNDSDLMLYPGEMTTETTGTTESYDASELLINAIR